MGFLWRRDLASDQEQVKEFDIPNIDLVIVDLYPFEDTVAAGASHEDIIEKIDIGGISLIRAAAKNYSDVAIVASQANYGDLLKMLQEQNGTNEDDRCFLATAAFNVSSHYDTHIHNYFAGDQNDAFKQSILTKNSLRYGENPHQQGTFFGELNDVFDKLHGKELSYNNLLDVDAAVQLMGDFLEVTQLSQ